MNDLKEKYLVINPSGSVKWIHTDRKHMAADFRKVIRCNWLENVYTVLPGIVIIVDEVGKVRQDPQIFNPVASRLYGGAPYGDFIHGPAVVACIGLTDEGMDWIPLQQSQLQLLQNWLQIELPEVPNE